LLDVRLLQKVNLVILVAEASPPFPLLLPLPELSYW
jgi:hypothetical protein